MTYEVTTEYKRSASLKKDEVPLAMAGMSEGVLNLAIARGFAS